MIDKQLFFDYFNSSKPNKQLQLQLFNHCDKIVKNLCAKYRRYPNYKDLLQDGRIALLQSLESLDPYKGNPYTWIIYYVRTALSRRAHEYCDFKAPLKRGLKFIKLNLEDISSMEDYSANIDEYLDRLNQVKKIIPILTDNDIKKFLDNGFRPSQKLISKSRQKLDINET